MDFKLNKLFLIISLIFAVVYGILGEIIYKIDFGTSSRIGNVVLYIIMFAVLFSLILIFRGITKRRYVKVGKLIKTILVLSLCFMILTPLFEFIYELGKGKIEIDKYDDIQYVYLIDDSGSMSTNDENNDRYIAVGNIINNMDTTDAFAVYRFANKAECVTGMGSTTSNNYKFNSQALNIGGSTNLLSSINDIIKNIDTRKINTKIIVLTDGSPSDNYFGKYNRVIKNCIKNNVSISAVGFGSPNERFLDDLAKSTGGVYVYSDSVDQLQNSLTAVVDTVTSSVSNNRDLLGYRLDSKAYNVLYILMRIIFLSILGIIWSMIKISLIGETLYADRILKIMGLLTCIAAVLIEVLLLVGVPELLVRMLFCILWSITLMPQYNVMNTEYSSVGISRSPVYH